MPKKEVPAPALSEDAAQADSEDLVAPAVVSPTAVEFSGDDRKRHESRITRQKEFLAGQRKVPVKVKTDTFIQINGYTMQLQPNVKVMVPEQVAEILEEAGRI